MTAFPFERAMHDEVMLAYLMNGEKLPKAHGFPLRLIVPGLYGIKNVKWITEIEVYNGDYQGYWQRKGWTDEGTIHIFSPNRQSRTLPRISAGPNVQFRGIAFGGPNSISQVQLSFDQEKTWLDATIEPPLSPWVLGGLELSAARHAGWQEPWSPFAPLIPPAPCKPQPSPVPQPNGASGPAQHRGQRAERLTTSFNQSMWLSVKLTLTPSESVICHRSSPGPAKKESLDSRKKSRTTIPIRLMCHVHLQMILRMSI